MSESHTSAGSPILDYAQLEPFAEIGFEDVRDILEEMLKDAPLRLASLMTAVRNGDAAAGKPQAHSLRGMVLNFGCTALAAALANIERAPAFPGGDPAVIIPELMDLWARTEAELKDWAASQEGSASP